MRLAAATCLATASLIGAAPAVADDPLVVELYTSQGCSSCPPADEMLGELAKRDDILALSLHVDYWDWIGWKDTFATPAFGQRQLEYSQVVGSNVRYTPQFVVSGEGRLAGPSGMQLGEIVETYGRATTELLSARDVPGGIRVDVAADDRGGELILITYQREATIKVLHGENAGRSITYHNIVRNWQVIQAWDGSQITLEVPTPDDEYNHAVIAQTLMAGGRPGPVVGAVKLD